MKKKKTIPIQVLMLLKINKKAENKSVEKTRNGISIFFVKSINLQIFNKWGNLVYETNDLDFKWDGTIQNNGEVSNFL